MTVHGEKTQVLEISCYLENRGTVTRIEELDGSM